MTEEAKFYQFTVENQVLDYVKQALRNTLLSDTERMGLARKISTVQFVTESLHRHLVRLLDWEDEAGLVDVDELDKPHLVEKATQIGREHKQLREKLIRLAAALPELTASDESYFQAFCRHVLEFLDDLDRHEKAEMLVLQQVYNDDEGGEG